MHIIDASSITSLLNAFFIAGAKNIETNLSISINLINPTESMVAFNMTIKGTLYKAPKGYNRGRQEYVPGSVVLSGSAKLIDVDRQT